MKRSISTIIFSLLTLILISQNCDRAFIMSDYQENIIDTEMFDWEIGWTGSGSPCDPGEISEEALTNSLKRINYFRRLAGVSDDITYNPSWQQGCQDMALMIKLNGLSHNPPSSWTCYTSAGAVAAPKSNIASWNPVKSIERFMQDGLLPGVGHRRWFLNSTATQMAVGGTNTSACVYVIGNVQPPAEPVEYIPFPSEGYFPIGLKPIMWSLANQVLAFLVRP